jgi:mannose-6-phosphate isomerase
MTIWPLAGVLRRYGWGSMTAIPQLLGVPPTGEPAAELWFGAHPEGPSPVPSMADTLDKLIARDPEALLGSASLDRFGPELPYLVKVIAAAKALSIQVHPTLEQAQAGFEAEEARGIPRDAPNRSYRDRNHKPELLCALSEVDALCGFRDVPRTLQLLDELAVQQLDRVRAQLAGGDGLRAAFTALLKLSDEQAPELVDAVVPACQRLVDQQGQWAAAARSTLLAAGDFPGDIGAVLALLLNTVRLRPGEAIFLGAGTVHAYLRGVGVEVMANSDNVLRCGLTPKHIDVPELLRITTFSSLPNPVRVARAVSPAERTFPVPVPDFALSVVEPGDEAISVPSVGPQILLCTDGRVELRTPGDTHALSRGQAAFVGAGAELSVTGSSTTFRTTTPAESG